MSGLQHRRTLGGGGGLGKGSAFDKPTPRTSESGGSLPDSIAQVSSALGPGCIFDFCFDLIFLIISNIPIPIPLRRFASRFTNKHSLCTARFAQRSFDCALLLVRRLHDDWQRHGLGTTKLLIMPPTRRATLAKEAQCVSRPPIGDWVEIEFEQGTLTNSC